jgi:mono/diheme cytochrome c family protein
MRPGTLLPALLLAGLFILFGSLSACSSGDETLASVEPASVPEFPTYDQVYTIIDRNCIPCHSDEKPRQGGLGLQEDDEDDDGDDPEYDSCQAIVEGYREILRVTSEETMPPGAWPRLSEREKLLLRNWVFNSGFCSPCTFDCP